MSCKSLGMAVATVLDSCGMFDVTFEESSARFTFTSILMSHPSEMVIDAAMDGKYVDIDFLFESNSKASGVFALRVEGSSLVAVSSGEVNITSPE